MDAKTKNAILLAAKTLLTDPTHDFSHAQRVERLCIKIAKTEKSADTSILFAASYLHDIGYSRDYEMHHSLGAKMAEKILKGCSFPKEKIPAVCSCISKHRFSTAHKGETIEEKILQDADKLDSMGAIGIARCYYWTGQRKLPLQIAHAHFPEKLLKLSSLMNTKEGKKIAKERHAYMQKFLAILD
ncbi:HD domain protein [Candidatus Anstonella stagnisolia]|nr:HD domain protein [Candidatus Anstonella stagnisolia]